MLVRLVFALLAMLSLAAADSFDKPKYKRTVDLGRSRSSPDRHTRVNCYFFSTFMVKEVDLGEKGADRLSIVPISHGVVPKCTRLQGKKEKVVNPDDWSGYFKGVKNDLVFFDADDLVNRGMGFAVYDSKIGKKIFEDSALGPLEFAGAPAGQVSFRYTRVFETQCILPQEPDACWAEIQKNTSLENTAMPDCKKGYEESAQNLAKGRCQAQNSDTPQCFNKEIRLARDQTKAANSVIAYPVAVTLGSQPVVKPVAGELQCWPSD